MSESAFKQPISLLLRQEWKRFGDKRHWARKPGCGRKHATAAAANPQVDPRAGFPWTPHREATAGLSHPRERLSRIREESNPPTLSSYLTDSLSRKHNYLRIAITERCNLRCIYCMPEDGVPLSAPAHLLTTPEIVRLSQLFVSQGVDKIRLTGGEPTVRKDILELMKQIGTLRAAGLKELCLTTNGLTLHRKLDAMVEAGLTGVNLSLDTLDPYQFTIMTRRNGHEAVMRSIEQILEMNKLGAGIKLKVNCVVMRGINEREIIPFVELGKDKDLEVRFIEYMPFDGNKWSKGKMLSFKEMLMMIREKYPDLQKVQDHANDTSKTYQVSGFLGKLGFITSMTHNFCGTCNRLRITCDGNLKVCLFGNSEVSLRDILRESNNGEPIDQATMEEINKVEMNARNSASGDRAAPALSSRDHRLLEIIGAAVKRKKAKHAGMGELENMKNRPMILIDDHYSASNAFSSPSQYSLGTIHSSPLRKRYMHANDTSIRQSIPSLIQLRNYCVEASREVVPLRDTLPTRPRKPGWLRPVHGQHTFRRIPSPDPVSWITPSEDAKNDISDRSSNSRRLYPIFGQDVLLKRKAETRDRRGSGSHTYIGRPRRVPSRTPIRGPPPNVSTQLQAPRLRLDKKSFSGDSRQASVLPPRSPRTSVEPGIPYKCSAVPAIETSALGDSSPKHHASPQSVSSSVSPGNSTHSTPPALRPLSSEGAESEIKPSASEARHIDRPSRTGHPSPPSPPSVTTTLTFKQDHFNPLSHLTSTGEAHMVDISHKIPTRRSATASAYVLFSNPHPYACLTHSSLPKGDAVAVARIAGIQAAKKTADLIPLAHPGLGITGVKVDIELLTPTRKHDAYSDPDIGEAGFQFGGVKISANVLCDGKTGVEMEALTAASMSALTMYDMCKAVDKHMTVTGVRVVMKKGGKGGHWSLNGDIPDPSPASPIFETALQRRMAGVVDDPGTYIPDIMSSRPAKPDLEDPPIAPEATPDFLQAAASELDLFVANTTSPTKAAEIAGLRRKHKALTARIREMQEKTQRGRGDEVEGGSVGGELRDGRVDYNVLQRLHGERRDIARRVLAWRIGGGSEIKEANENERELDVFQQSRNQFAEKEGGRWKWDAGVYGVWKEERRNGDLGEEGGERYKK